MRNSILLYSAVIVLSLLVSCAGTPVEDSVVSETTEISRPASAGDDVSGIRSVWKPETTVFKYVDGSIDKTITRTYDSGGRILRSIDADSRGVVIYEQEFEYLRGILERERMFDGSGLISTATYTSNSDGLPVKQVKTDSEGNTVSGMSYKYSGDTLVSTVAEDEKGLPLLIIEYTYNGDLLSSAEYRLPNGESDGRFERSIENGLVTGEQTIMPDGTVTSSVMFEYEGDRIVRELHYSGTTNFKSADFEYDDEGNVVREVWYDGNGSEYEIVERSWLQFEEIK